MKTHATPKATTAQNSATKNAFFVASGIYPKLTINAPNDKFEQEADAMAERVMAMPEGEHLQRMCQDCEGEKLQNDQQLQRKHLNENRQKEGLAQHLEANEVLMTKPDGGTTNSPDFHNKLQSSKGGGSTLSAHTNRMMSQAFGADFSNVRVHTGTQADEMNTEIRAKAFTNGSDIYFRDGQYNPGSSQGKKLLAHELTHVVQQLGDDKLAASTTEEKTWRASGNLVGSPPVRNEESPPNKNIVENISTYNGLLEKALAFLERQKERADSMLDKDGKVTDYRYWFARVYQFVTENEIKHVRAKAFYYPSYVLRSVLYFEKIFGDNFNVFDKAGPVESHWQKAFQTGMQQKEFTDNLKDQMLNPAPSFGPAGNGRMGVSMAYLTQLVMGATKSLVSAMKAHIRFDLPRAEAWVFNTYYSHYEGASLSDFRPDFMSMSGVFDNAAAMMNKDMAERLGLPVDLMPQLTQDIAMRNFFDADMATERADTWRRAELLVENDLTTSNPYSFDRTGKMQGDVTHADHMAGLIRLPQEDLIPSMDESAKLSDEQARDIINNKDLSTLSATTRVRLIRALFKGNTFNEDEEAILKVLRASVSDPAFVDIVDGGDAWDLLYAFDFSQHVQLRALFKRYYYSNTGLSTAIRLAKKCLQGETAEWEETMVLDLIIATSESQKFIHEINAHTILYNLSGAEYKKAKNLLKDYYRIISEDSAYSYINRCIRGSTAEWEQEMIIDILLIRDFSSAKRVIQKIGIAEEGDAGNDFTNYKNGLNILEWNLDFSEESKLDEYFGDY